MFTKIKILFIVLYGLFTIPASAMESAAAPAGSQSVPLIDGQHTHKQALAIAIRWSNLERVKKLLADPATCISDAQENNILLLTVMENVKAAFMLPDEDSSKEYTIIKMLLFFGVDPTYRNPKRPKDCNAQEVAFDLKDDCPELLRLTNHYKNIEKYCSEQELEEFTAVRKLRHIVAQERERLAALKKYGGLMRREVGGLEIKKISVPKLAAQTATAPDQSAAAAPSAAAPKHTWPSKKDSKENQ